MTTTAILDADRKTFKMRRGVWSSECPISDLPKWLAFYRREQELYPAHARQYAESCEALEKLVASLGRRSAEAVGDEPARLAG